MSTTEDEDWGKVSDLLGPKLVVVLNLVLESKALNKLAIGYLALQGKFYANETEVKKWNAQRLANMNFATTGHYNFKLGIILPQPTVFIPVDARV